LCGTAIGMLSVHLKRQARGDDKEMSYGQWVAKGFEQSGQSGWLFDFDRMLEQASMGKFSVSTALGTEGTRYYSPQTAYAAILGPVYRQAMEAILLTGGVLDLDPDEQDVRRLRRLIPLNNLFYLRQLFTQLEEKGERIVR